MNYENIPFVQKEHDWLVTYFKKHQTMVSLNKDWVSRYLKIVKYVIDKFEFKNSDENFVLTLPKKFPPLPPVFFPVIVADRYVLAGHSTYSGYYTGEGPDEDPTIAIILQYRFWNNLTEKQKNNVYCKADLFNPYPNEGMPPLFLYLHSISGIEDMMNAWTDSIRTEKDGKKRSLQRRFHKPLMYKLVTDPEYQEQFFHEVF